MPVPLGFWATTGSNGGAGAYELIATGTGTGSNTAITFSSIPTTYKHLQLRIVGRNSSTQTQGGATVRFNADSATNYSQHELLGNGTTVTSTGNTSIAQMSGAGFVGNGSTANIFGAGIWDILDAFSTTKYKTVRSLGGGTTTNMGISQHSGMWRNTAAITSIEVQGSAGFNLLSGTRISLYGIKG